MEESNFHVLDINMVHPLDDQEELTTPLIDESFLNSPWYDDIMYVFSNLNAPPRFSKTKARFLKLKAVKFCILDNVLYWKDTRDIFLKCLLKDDADRLM